MHQLILGGVFILLNTTQFYYVFRLKSGSWSNVSAFDRETNDLKPQHSELGLKSKLYLFVKKVQSVLMISSDTDSFGSTH